MACDSFLSYVNRDVTSAGLTAQIYLLREYGATINFQEFANLYGCQFLLDNLPALIASYDLDNPVQGYFADGYALDFSIINFATLAPSPPVTPGALYVRVTQQYYDQNEIDRGYFQLNYGSNGLLTSVENHLTIPTTYVMGSEANSSGFRVWIDYNQNPDLLQVTITVPNIPCWHAVNDYAGWLGCVVPMCGITPPPSDPVAYNPSVGIRCANFSKVINPFGFQRK